jgi:hypothetical protein
VLNKMAALRAPRFCKRFMKAALFGKGSVKL